MFSYVKDVYTHISVRTIWFNFLCHSIFFPGHSDTTEHLLASLEEPIISSTYKSSPSLLYFPPPKKKSILKHNAHKAESENLLTPVSHSFTYGVQKYNNLKPFYNSFTSNDHLDNLNVPADRPQARNGDNWQELTGIKTGNLNNNVNLPNQKLSLKQQSSDSYTDDSQFNTFDKSDEEFEFSDSAAFNAFKPAKGNIYQNSDSHGIVTWQTDTSPSDNLENDDICFGSLSNDHTPSPEISFSDQNFNRTGSSDKREIVESNHSSNDNPSPNGNSGRATQRGSNLLQLMSNLHRTSPTTDGRTSLASPDG